MRGHKTDGGVPLSEVVDKVWKVERVNRRAEQIKRHWEQWPKRTHSEKLAILRDLELRAELKRR